MKSQEVKQPARNIDNWDLESEILVQIFDSFAFLWFLHFVMLFVLSFTSCYFLLLYRHIHILT